MKLSRFISFALIFIGVFAALALMTSLVQATPNSGTITICDDVHLTTALVGGGTVTFNCGGPATLIVTSTKTIAAHTTINGSNNDQQLTLTAASGVQLFSINSGIGLTLTNLTIANLNYSAYPVYNQGTLVISNSTFVSNTNGVIDNRTGATLNIINSTLRANTAPSAEIIYNRTGAVLNIISSTLSANSSPSGDIINNTANATTTVTSSVFISNTAYKIIITQGNLTVTGSSVVTNSATYGAVIYSYNPAAIVIDASQFISNAGGVIYNMGPLTVTNATFLQNTGGWAVVANGATSINNSDFISNTGGAMYYQSSSPVLISNSRFYWNRNSGYAAAAIHMYGFGLNPAPALTVTNSSFMSNTASYGTIYNYYNGTIYLSNTNFISNTSPGSTGALYLDYPGVVQVLSSTFQINTGGGIYVNGSANPLLIADSQFISNTSASAGAISAGTITVTRSNFKGNISTGGNPGALDASRQAYITGSTFINNIGAYGGSMNLTYGGVGCSSGCYDVVANTIVSGNKSLAFGGGGIRATQNLTLTDSQIVNNVAVGDNNGGGLNFAGYVLTAARNLFQNNIVTGTNGTGGGLYVSGSASSIADSTVISNSAGGSGGGIYLNYASIDGPAYITHTTVQSNTASTTSSAASGGGIYATAGWGSINLNMSDVALSNNRALGNAGGTGGGLYFYGGYDAGVLTVTRSLISSNAIAYTAGQGGGLYLNGGATIMNSTLYSNSAASGSGTYLAGTSVTLTLASVTVMSNTTATGVITNQLNNAGTDYRFRLVNTIVGGGGNCAGNKFLSLGHNLSSDASCALTGTLDLSNTNPLLGAFQNNGGSTESFMPTANSPAVNADDPANCPGDDQRGVARPIGSACDIGAIESPYLTPQSITFVAIPNHFVNDAPFVITPTATSSLAVSVKASGVCSVNAMTVTLSGSVGSCTITATQLGDANYAAAADVVRTFSVTLVSQTITFDPLPDQMITTPPFTITASASSNLPVSFNANGACSVNGITVTLSVVGTCTITATQSGNLTFAPATPVARSFSVTPQSPQTITFDLIPDHFVSDPPFTVAPTASSGLSVTVTSLTTSVCSINSDLVTLLIAGTCTLHATQSGNATFAAAPPVDRSFNVNQHLVYLPLIKR